MTTQTLQLKVKTTGNDGKNYWDRCGTVFINTNDQGEITSVSVKHSMFPNVDMAAFPRREQNTNDNGDVTE
jgi:hypothetical protein